MAAVTVCPTRMEYVSMTQAITRSFALIGEVMSAGNDLMRVAGWNVQSYPPSTRPEIVTRRDKYVQTFYSAMTAWEKERDRQALRWRYYHNANIHLRRQ